MKFGIITDNKGSVDQVEINLALSAEAKAAGAKHPLAYLDSKVAVAPGMPTARQQVYHRLGYGDKSISLKDAMEASAVSFGLTGPSTQSNDVVGRMATQSFLFDAIENKLRATDDGMAAIFNSRAAAIDSVASTKFDRPILNFSRPEAGRSRNVAQLSEVANLMLLTVSDNSYRIPSSAIGLEYSDQAAASVSLPIVTLSVTRQAEIEAMERIEGYLLSFLIGDSDLGMTALSSVPGAVKNAKTDYDSTLAAGTLSQKAWVNWLYANSANKKIDTIICDISTALAIENRTGRPTVQTDNATSKRIDTGMTVLNPTWGSEISVIVSRNPSFPANTIVSFDSTAGYHVVNSTVLAYEAMESYSMRRSTRMRFDSGSIAYRLFDDAWSVLSLT